MKQRSKKRKRKARRGRPRFRPPRLTLDDVEQMRKMASYGMSHEGIADVLGCSADTLTRNYADPLKKGRAEMQKNLRAAQMRLALAWPAQAGTSTMLIWLGKQVLGQTDQVDFGGTIEHKHSWVDELSETTARALVRLAEVRAAPFGPN